MSELVLFEQPSHPTARHIVGGAPQPYPRRAVPPKPVDVGRHIHCRDDEAGLLGNGLENTGGVFRGRHDPGARRVLAPVTPESIRHAGECDPSLLQPRDRQKTGV